MRDLDLYFDAHNISPSAFCKPGATIYRLRTFIKELVLVPEETVDCVVLQVGTNDLSKSVWDVCVNHYKQLYFLVRETFPNAIIVFCSILPRWDDQVLYDNSLYFNLKLHNLVVTLPSCKFVDFSNNFNRSDLLFCSDGLHLNRLGKCTYAHQLGKAVDRVLGPKPADGPKFVPQELKILWTPKKVKKVEKVKDGSPPRPMNAGVQRRCSSRRRWQWRKKWSVDWDGNVTPRKTASAPTTPELPPWRHIPDARCSILIPYVDSKRKQTQIFQQSSSHLPQPPTLYVQRKKKGKAKHRRDSATRKRKKRKKVMFTFNTCTGYE